MTANDFALFPVPSKSFSPKSLPLLIWPGGTPIGRIGLRHAPVKRPPFLHGLVIELPPPLFFHKLHPDPLILLFRSKSTKLTNFEEKHANRSEIYIFFLNVPRFCAILHPYDEPLFGYVIEARRHFSMSAPPPSPRGYAFSF